MSVFGGGFGYSGGEEDDWEEDVRSDSYCGVEELGDDSVEILALGLGQ